MDCLLRDAGGADPRRSPADAEGARDEPVKDAIRQNLAERDHRGRSSADCIARARAACARGLPELDENAVFEATRTIILLVGALWTHAHPPQAVKDAYAADPGLSFLPDGFAGSLECSVRIVLAGHLAET